MLRLESFAAGDYPQLINWLDTDRLLKEWSGPLFAFPLTVVQLQHYGHNANQPEQSEVFAYKAVDSNTGATMGHISLDYINWNDRTGRISRVLVGEPELRNRGYGQAMVKALLKIGFEHLSLRRISLGVYDFNASAIRCYQRCGFHHMGTLRHVVRYQDEDWSLVEMCMMQDDWRKYPTPSQAA